MAASKKGVCAKQLQRTLGLGYRAAWFMAHRIRTAMTPRGLAKLGGAGKVLESDETFVGGKAKNAHTNKPDPEEACRACACRARRSASRQRTLPMSAPRRSARCWTSRPIAKSALHTDDSLANLSLGKHFAEHRTVAHTLGEYVTEDGAGAHATRSRASSPS